MMKRDLLDDKEVTQVIALLETAYPEAGCELAHEDPFQLLVAVVLSAQTTDVRVNEVTDTLFRDYPDLEAMLTLDETTLAERIRSIGMYRMKARHVLALCRRLMDEYGGRVPDSYDELIKLPGVGRKTANVVLSNAFGQPAIAVDTHVFRVANRIGIVSAKDPLKTELGLMERLPKSKWTAMHHMLIWHGRRQCHARSPKCGTCSLNVVCRAFCSRQAAE